ncbi:DMT family transporter [Candidatus Pelagibacter sp.]|nr:DMT family transporter [Candidatus Pelagibacter sp.]|tara:strand:- start:1403 stop:2275 length:873 start_codon:yes stop_codon:yes gene_type:complete
MSLLYKIPGYILVVLGAVTLSFGGLIVKSFEGSTLWQILFWRSFFFCIVIIIFLLINYKKKFFSSIISSGLPGIIGGIILGFGFFSYVFAMYNTTVANANFIIQTQTLFLAIFGYIFLKEKIAKITLISIILAISGITLMLGHSLTSGQILGNIVAFIMPISFAALIIIVRKYPNIDMVPLQLIAGIIAMVIGYYAAGRIDVSLYDIFLGFIAGFFQVGLGFIFITIGARSTPSAVVGIIMMSEAIFGPLWAWIFINEQPQTIVFIGGSIILLAVLIQLVNKFFSESKSV